MARRRAAEGNASGQPASAQGEGSLPSEEDEDSDSGSDSDEMEDMYMEEEDSSEDGEGAVATFSARQFFLHLSGAYLGSGGVRSSGRIARSLERYGPVPTDPLPLEDTLAQEVKKATAAQSARHTTAEMRKHQKTNSLTMLRRRQAGVYCGGGAGGWSPAQRCHLLGEHYLPNRPLGVRASMQSRAYIGQYSHEGNLFVGAFQADKRVRVYDTENGWKMVKDVHARNLRWTITDTCLSKDQRLLLYATINPIVHMVNVDTGGVDSEANVTEIHEGLHLDEMEGGGPDAPHGHFGIFSICWAGNGQEIAAGTGDHKVLVYNMERGKTTTSIAGHDDDVNAVAFLDDSSNTIVSGSDDHSIKVWDRRSSDRNGKAAGVLVGHTQGVTHIDPKGDGRYLLSNSKDQTAKVWDVRKMISYHKFRKLPDPDLPTFGWDYRWNDFPGRGFDIRHPNDSSVQTLRGHYVATTLIRAYWSPMHTTGQRYVYTGSADGAVYIYDLVTSKVVPKEGPDKGPLTYQARGHKEILRDVSWHPYKPSLVSAGFDGFLTEWGYDTRDMAYWTQKLPKDGLCEDDRF